jgi:hypothetical protein
MFVKVARGKLSRLYMSTGSDGTLYEGFNVNSLDVKILFYRLSYVSIWLFDFEQAALQLL